MKQYHVPDEILQQYALDELQLESTQMAHIISCNVCKLKIEDYRSLVTSISSQNIPSFDFNLAATVLAKLPVPPKKADDTKLVSMLVIMAFLIILIPAFIFRDYLLMLINTSMITLIGIIGVAAILIVSIQAVDMYKRYQQRMRQLNLY
jgi:hypothetical protein